MAIGNGRYPAVRGRVGGGRGSVVLLIDDYPLHGAAHGVARPQRRRGDGLSICILDGVFPDAQRIAVGGHLAFNNN